MRDRRWGLEGSLHPVELLDVGHLEAERLLTRVAHDEKGEAVAGHVVGWHLAGAEARLGGVCRGTKPLIHIERRFAR